MTSALLDVVMKTTALAMGAFMVIAAMRRSSAAARHLTWTAMFSAIVLLPVFTLTLPVIPIAVLASRPAPILPRPIEPTFPKTAPAPLDDRAADVPTVVPPAASGFATAPANINAWTAEQWMAATWIVGAAIVFLRGLVGLFLARRLDRRAHEVTDRELIDRLDQVRHAARLRRSIRLLISPAERMPATWGLIRPTILLPSSALTWVRECPDRLIAVLAHETAHVARWDVVSQFFARLGVTMFWFNPLIWIAARRARLERELACDDAVLALGTKPSDYASQLVAVVQSLATRSFASDHTLAMARSSQIERRVRAILDARVNRRCVSRSRLMTVAVLVAVMLPASSIRLTARARPVELSAPAGLDVPVSTELPALPSAVRPTTSVRADTPASLVQQPPPQQLASSQAVAAWRAEREALLRQLLERAQRHWTDALTKVQIGTMAPIDTVTYETTVATLEQAVFAEEKRVFSNGAPSDAEMAAVRQRFAQALRNLEVAEVRSNNGLLTSKELSAAVMAAADVIRLPAIPSGSGQADSMFNTTNFPGSTAADRNSARALYELLTGRVSSISGTAQAQSALQNIQEAQRLLQNQQADQDVKGLQRQAEELSKQQRDVSALVADLVSGGSGRDQRLQQISQTKDQMRGLVAGIEQQLARLSRAAQAAKDWDSVRRLQDAEGLIRDWMIKEKIEYSKQAMAGGSDYSKPIEREITANLDALRQRIAEAAAVAERAQQPPLSDAALVTALKNAAKMASGADRASTLIALAQRQAFTPEMVSLYVAAASGIPLEADRARAFAQAIRVKPIKK